MHCRLKLAKADLDMIKSMLDKKQIKLAEVGGNVKELQEKVDKIVFEKQKLEKSMQQTQLKLKRAIKLTTALAEEKFHWEDSIQVKDFLYPIV